MTDRPSCCSWSVSGTGHWHDDRHSLPGCRASLQSLPHRHLSELTTLYKLTATSSTMKIFSRSTAARSMIGYWHDTVVSLSVRLPVCLWNLSWLNDASYKANCLFACAYDWVHCGTQYSAERFRVLIIFPLIFKTITTAQVMIGRRGHANVAHWTLKHI